MIFRENLPESGVSPNHPRICYVVSSEITVAAFLREHIRHAATCYDVTVAVNTGNPEFLATLGLKAELQSIAIERKIAPWRDLQALTALYRLFRRRRFELVHSVSPKAGLLAMLAGRLARVPVRIHTFTGQVWVTRRGYARGLLKLMDRLIALFATHVLIDSPTQREFLLAQRVVSAEKSGVLGKGSVSGVDASRFRPDPQARAAVRQKLGYRDSDVVLLFLGRLNRDKGVIDLAQAFARIAATAQNARLLVIGPDEDGIQSSIQASLVNAAAQAQFIAYTGRPEDYMAAADVFCLPSYREGFGTTIIEAAATGIPAIGSRIYGITDAIDDGTTGLLFDPGDIGQLADAMLRLVSNELLRREMGERARARALRDFPAGAITAELMRFYASAIG